MTAKLLDTIQSRIALSPSDSQLIAAAFEPVWYPKNKIIEARDKVPAYLYFITSGYLRLYHYDHKGDEVTTHLNCPPGFFTSYQHFIAGTRSTEIVESVTDCTLLRITKADLDRLTATSAAMHQYSIQVFQESLLYNENRSRQLATLSSEQRYIRLMAEHPHILHHVPVQYIASFLGMKPESLSRIRRKLIN